MAKKSEGAVVVQAYKAPEVEHDELIDQILARSQEEYARQSDAGESGAKVTAFLEKTGLNSQAFSWGKSILKKQPKKDGQAKAMDIIRSLKAILPMLEAHIAGQGSGELDLSPPAPAKPQAPAEPMSDEEVAALAGSMDEDLDRAESNVRPVQFG
jgi:hypothetical protein